MVSWNAVSKTPTKTACVMGAPSDVDPKQLEDVHIAVVLSEAKEEPAAE